MAIVLLETCAAYSQEDTRQNLPESPQAMKATTAALFQANRTEAISPTMADVDSNGTARGVSGHLEDLFEDQRQIWTSPFRAHPSDAAWLVPLGGLAAGPFVTDRQYSASLSQDPSTLRRYKNVSNAGIASLIGGAAGLYVLSYPTHNQHWRETGFLAGEAALNSLLTAESLKYSFGRERPYQNSGGGHFFQGGTSLPSEHAAVAWSIAGVIGHEYPGTFPSLLAYGAASAVSFARVRAREHFPSDVLIGSAIGFLVAQNVYRRRHDPEIGGGAWQSAGELFADEKSHLPAYMGSPYVPLDSWIYPAMERLAARGFVRSDVIGMRPWTRLECARLLSEAAESQPDLDGSSDVRSLYESLSEEFDSEFKLLSGEQNVQVQVESVYSRMTGIIGTPLTDGEHFGQTIWNDFGRPYQQGLNGVSGASAWMAAGPFVIYARGEYQSAPSAPAPAAAAMNFISYADSLPPNAPLNPVASISRFRPLDLYVGMNLANWQISFGRQSLWWGPGDEGAMLFSDNAEPLNKMIRISRVSPIQLPPLLGISPVIRMEFFLGQLAGHEFVNNGEQEGVTNSGLIGTYGKSLNPQPYLSGEKIAVKFTPNVEIAMAKTTLYGGPGNPLTLNTLFKSTVGAHLGNSPIGDGRASLDFTYRVPKLRDWLSLYGDAFQEDEISPLNRPYKAAFQTGIYLARIPKVPKLDLRIEGGTTSPLNFPTCSDCYYSNGQYVNGYTNNGQILGTWIGRAAQGEALKSTYWFTGQRKVEFELRHRKIDQQYLPQGGTQNDVAVNSDFFVTSGFRLSGSLQYERWQIPLLASERQSNWTTTFQIGYWPRSRAK